MILSAAILVVIKTNYNLKMIYEQCDKSIVL